MPRSHVHEAGSGCIELAVNAASYPGWGRSGKLYHSNSYLVASHKALEKVYKMRM